MEVFLSNCIQNQQLGQESEIKLITSTVYFLMFLNSSARIW